MLFDDLDDETRKNTIRWLEESIFDAYLYGGHYFKDVPSTITGFSESMFIDKPKPFRLVIHATAGK